MKSKNKKLLALIAFGVIITLWIMRYTYLNSTWPNAEVLPIPMGESIKVNGIEYQILDAKIGTTRSFLGEYNPMLEDNISQEIEAQLAPLQGDLQGHYLLGVELAITNHTDQSLSASSCIFLPVYWSTWHNGASAYMFSYINQNYNSSILPGTTERYIIAYNLYEEMFDKTSWQQLFDATFKFPITFYPQKIELECLATYISE